MTTTNRFQAGGNAAIDEVTMEIKQYLERQCQRNTLRRCDIPGLLGYRNIPKALRRYDAFVNGNITDEWLANRIRCCPVLAGDDFDLALAHTAHRQMVDRKEQGFQKELRRRLSFTPHLWFEHENFLPRMFRPVAQRGEEFFRRLDLPPEMDRSLPFEVLLLELRPLLKEFITRNPNHHLLHGLFGKAVSVVFRDTYDHGYVLNLETFDVIDERHTAPRDVIVYVGPSRRVSSSKLLRHNRRKRRR